MLEERAVFSATTTRHPGPCVILSAAVLTRGTWRVLREGVRSSGMKRLPTPGSEQARHRGAPCLPDGSQLWTRSSNDAFDILFVVALCITSCSPESTEVEECPSADGSVCLDPRLLDFGSVAGDFRQLAEATIVNTTAVPAVVIEATLDNEDAFGVEDIVGLVVEPGESEGFVVYFEPPDSGPHSGTLTVVFDVSEVPQTLDLRGTSP